MKREKDVLTVAEIERLYPDEWVLIEIVKDHARHERVKGRVLVHTKDYWGILEPYQRFKASNPDGMTYQFFTGDIVAPGVVAVL